MRQVILILAFLIISLGNVDAYEYFLSPNGHFEAYTTANESNGTGMKLFIRTARSRSAGYFLLQNDRWITVKWSSDSRFLAVVDHVDGHMTDVYVFGVTATDTATSLVAKLLYHTPALRTYDVQWDVLGWRARQRQIILKRDVRNQSVGTLKSERIVAHIGIKALKLPIR